MSGVAVGDPEFAESIGANAAYFAPHTIEGATDKVVKSARIAYFADFVQNHVDFDAFSIVEESAESAVCAVCKQSFAADANAASQFPHGTLTSAPLTRLAVAQCALLEWQRPAHSFHRECYAAAVLDRVAQDGGQRYSGGGGGGGERVVRLLDACLSSAQLREHCAARVCDDGRTRFVLRANAVNEHEACCPFCVVLGLHAAESRAAAVAAAMREGFNVHGERSAHVALSLLVVGSNALVARGGTVVQRHALPSDALELLLEHAALYTLLDFGGYRAVDMFYVCAASDADAERAWKARIAAATAESECAASPFGFGGSGGGGGDADAMAAYKMRVAEARTAELRRWQRLCEARSADGSRRVAELLQSAEFAGYAFVPESLVRHQSLARVALHPKFAPAFDQFALPGTHDAAADTVCVWMKHGDALARLRHDASPHPSGLPMPYTKVVPLALSAARGLSEASLTALRAFLLDDVAAFYRHYGASVPKVLEEFSQCAPKLGLNKACTAFVASNGGATPFALDFSVRRDLERALLANGCDERLRDVLERSGKCSAPLAARVVRAARNHFRRRAQQLFGGMLDELLGESSDGGGDEVHPLPSNAKPRITALEAENERYGAARATSTAGGARGVRADGRAVSAARRVLASDCVRIGYDLLSALAALSGRCLLLELCDGARAECSAALIAGVVVNNFGSSCGVLLQHEPVVRSASVRERVARVCSAARDVLAVAVERASVAYDVELAKFENGGNGAGEVGSDVMFGFGGGSSAGGGSGGGDDDASVSDVIFVSDEESSAGESPSFGSQTSADEEIDQYSCSDGDGDAADCPAVSDVMFESDEASSAGEAPSSVPQASADEDFDHCLYSECLEKAIAAICIERGLGEADFELPVCECCHGLVQVPREVVDVKNALAIVARSTWR